MKRNGRYDSERNVKQRNLYVQNRSNLTSLTNSWELAIVSQRVSRILCLVTRINVTRQEVNPNKGRHGKISQVSRLTHTGRPLV
jgi:hypothetical protein